MLNTTRSINHFLHLGYKDYIENIVGVVENFFENYFKNPSDFNENFFDKSYFENPSAYQEYMFFDDIKENEKFLYYNFLINGVRKQYDEDIAVNLLKQVILKNPHYLDKDDTKVLLFASSLNKYTSGSNDRDDYEFTVHDDTYSEYGEFNNYKYINFALYLKQLLDIKNLNALPLDYDLGLSGLVNRMNIDGYILNELGPDVMFDSSENAFYYPYENVPENFKNNLDLVNKYSLLSHTYDVKDVNSFYDFNTFLFEMTYVSLVNENETSFSNLLLDSFKNKKEDEKTHYLIQAIDYILNDYNMLTDNQMYFNNALLLKFINEININDKFINVFLDNDSLSFLCIFDDVKENYLKTNESLMFINDDFIDKLNHLLNKHYENPNLYHYFENDDSFHKLPSLFNYLGETDTNFQYISKINSGLEKVIEYINLNKNNNLDDFIILKDKFINYALSNIFYNDKTFDDERIYNNDTIYKISELNNYLLPAIRDKISFGDNILIFNWLISDDDFSTNEKNIKLFSDIEIEPINDELERKYSTLDLLSEEYLLLQKIHGIYMELNLSETLIRTQKRKF